MVSDPGSAAALGLVLNHRGLALEQPAHVAQAVSLAAVLLHAPFGDELAQVVGYGEGLVQPLDLPKQGAHVGIVAPGLGDAAQLGEGEGVSVDHGGYAGWMNSIAGHEKAASVGGWGKRSSATLDDFSLRGPISLRAEGRTRQEGLLDAGRMDRIPQNQ